MSHFFMDRPKAKYEAVRYTEATVDEVRQWLACVDEQDMHPDTRTIYFRRRAHWERVQMGEWLMRFAMGNDRTDFWVMDDESMHKMKLPYPQSLLEEEQANV